MNILYIHTHDTGRYIQPYGYQVSTPNLMEFTQNATLFRNAYCAGPTCSPSRAGLLTGMAPHSCGMFGLAHRGFQLDDYDKHIVSYLNKHGYDTVLCGIQHVAPREEMIGYKKIITVKRNRKESENYDIQNAKAAAEYIESNDGKPFFLSFGMFHTHREFPEVDEDINPDYVVPPFPLYDTRENREDMAAYITSARIMDRCVGIVLKALEKKGLRENTVIFFTTDHGIAFPKMKCSLYDTGIGISFIMDYPNNKIRRTATDALISHIDVFPTLCDILGLEKPAWLQGVSILPILEGKTDRIRDEIFSEVTYHAAYEPMRCVRTDRYKLIMFYDQRTHIVPSNIDDSLSKNFLIKNRYLDTKRDKEMLFDLYLDPVERVNLINDVKYKTVYKDLSNRLQTWMEETNDPLLMGKIEKPKGAIVNTLSCLSPEDEEFE